MWPKRLISGMGVTLLAFTSLGGCVHPEPRARMQDEIKSALSWSAALQLGISAWSDKKVPSPYTRDLVAQAADGWSSSAETVKELPSGKERDALLADLSTLRKIAAGLSTAVQARKRKAARPQLRQLQMVEGDLRQRQQRYQAAQP